MNYHFDDLDIALARLHQQEVRAAVARNRLIAQAVRQRQEGGRWPRVRATLRALALAAGSVLGALVRVATRPQPFVAHWMGVFSRRSKVPISIVM